MSRWEMKTLGEVCSLIKRGIAPKYVETGGTTVVNQKCIRNHRVNLELARQHNRIIKSVNAERFIRKGDVLVNSTGTGTLGRVAQVDTIEPHTVTVDTHVTIVRPKEGLFYLPYFGYAMISIEEEIKEEGEGASGQTELSRTKLSKTFRIPLPPLSVQREIVERLDAAFALIDRARANVERGLGLVGELWEGVLEGEFELGQEGTKRAKLKDIITIKHGWAFKSQYFTTEGKYELLTPGNFFESGGYRYRGEKQKFYDGEFPEEYVLKAGDLLVAMTEQAAGLLGSPLLVPEDGTYLHNQRLGLVRSKDPSISNEYLYHIFNTRHVRRSLYESGTGAKVRHTSPSRIGEVEVWIKLNAEARLRAVSRLDSFTKCKLDMMTTLEAKRRKVTCCKQSILSTLINRSIEENGLL